MFFKQAEIFWGMDRVFIGDLMEGAEKMSCQREDKLFAKGDPANNFYILVKGRVKINIVEVGKVAHTVSHAGEAFGWSSLTGRDFYSASAICSEPTQLMILNKEHVWKVCAKHPEHGMVFFQRLAGVLGSRLVQSYRMLISESQADTAVTSGTGQVAEPEEAM